MGVSELERVPKTCSSSPSTTVTPIDIVTDGERIKQAAITFTSTDEPPISYPEGGTSAWLVVLGSWLALFSSMGLMNSIGAFHAHIQRNQLSDHSPSSVSWIIGVYCGLAFFCGILAGPVFDARGPRALIMAGGMGTVSFLLLLGVCTRYWHFMLVFGVLGGVSLSLVFGPAVGVVAHYFSSRRGLATGVASSGASAGGVVFPLALQRLYPLVGFAWATRIVALVCACAFAAAMLLIRKRFPPKPLSAARALPDLTILRNPALCWTAMGAFFMEWGLFVPLSYLASYALNHGQSPPFSYMLLALINAGAVPGRWVPGYLSDRLGRFNMLIATILGCGLSLACLWLTSGSNAAQLAAFAVIFGFFSGGNVSLAPVCIGQLCTIESYGRYYATANVLVSIR